MNVSLLAISALLVAAGPCLRQAKAQVDVNYDEAKVHPYTLPDPLVANDGTKITSAAQWRDSRREELLKLFEEHVYGRRGLGDGVRPGL